MSQPPIDPTQRPSPTPRPTRAETRAGNRAGERARGRRAGTDPASGDVTANPPRRHGVARTRKSRRRRRIAFIAGALSLFMVFGLLGVVYAATKIPLPGDVKNNQSSIIYYSDGRTEIARIGAENRTDVKLSDLPKHLQHAVLAAENRDYYTDSGVSPKGIARALWANLRGKDLQGGSTITQQYAKNAYLNQERTYTRKFRELVIAVKLDKSYSKDQILEWYLNTIYFGRGAYGIEAASETYFGIPATKLTVEQSAVLASSIRSPALYDPEVHPQAAKDRWAYVLDGMVTKNWLSATTRAALKYPPVRPNGVSRFNDLSGPKGYIVRQVAKELAAKGITDDVVRRSGMRIVTTIDKQAEDSAVAAVNKVFNGQPKDLRQALVAIEPTTGRVRAYYGGKIGNGALDYASRSFQPGSSIKPYVLAEALSQGISLKSYWDGSSPQEFPDRPGRPVYNSGDGQGAQCSSCDLIRATVLSLNTVYYALTDKVGAKKAAALAERAGIRTLAGKPTQEFIDSGNLTNNFGIGQFEITTLDQAAGYATFAARGVHHTPYFVEKAILPDNKVAYEHARDPGTRAFSADVSADATYAMQKVLQGSTGSFNRELENGREAAAKTGTAQDPRATRNNANGGGNSAAWMCGFTPQLAAAVWVGHDNLKTPLVTATGRQIYGVGLPGLTWQAFMNGALRGKPELKLPPPVFLGKRDGNSSPPPAPRPTPSTAPSPSPTPLPSPRPSKSCKKFPVCPPNGGQSQSPGGPPPP
ncbi:MAG: transglycosylase domain-containing protein [Mycobacteriales bacterium]